MTEVSTDAKIKELINTIYKTDVQAIRNLSDIARKLQGEGGKDLILPGNFTIEGSLKVAKDTTIGGKTTLKKELTTELGATFATGSGRPLKITSSKYGTEQSYLSFYNGKDRTGYILPTTTKDIIVNTQNLRVSGNNTVNGNNTVKGTSTVIGNSIVKSMSMNNYVRYVQIGNTKSPVWHQFWSIGEVRVFDENNNNVALKKPVKLLEGAPLNNSPVSAITNGIVQTGVWGQYFHGGGNKRSLLEIDLGKEYNISSIHISGRWHGSLWGRQKGTHIETFDGNHKSHSIGHVFANGGVWAQVMFPFQNIPSIKY